MIRIAGFLVGSAIAITAILVVFGVPQFQSSEPEPTPEPIALQSLPETDVLQIKTPPEVVQPIVAPAIPVTTESQWHSFWSPFGSQIAANGFVSRLEAVTGYDYRVVKIRAGVYEVTFAYVDEEERLSKLSVIASATGLELPDS